MLFYGKYENGKRYICAYDEEKHGAPRVVSDHWTYLYHKSVIVNRVYKTEREAMEDSWGKYSNKSVIMPDGTETTPARYFGTEDTSDVFISWYDVKGELWPGETAQQARHATNTKNVKLYADALKSPQQGADGARTWKEYNMENIKERFEKLSLHEKNYINGRKKYCEKWSIPFNFEEEIAFFEKLQNDEIPF